MKKNKKNSSTHDQTQKQSEDQISALSVFTGQEWKNLSETILTLMLMKASLKVRDVYKLNTNARYWPISWLNIDFMLKKVRFKILEENGKKSWDKMPL